MKVAMQMNLSRRAHAVNGPFRRLMPLLVLVVLTGCHTVGRNIDGIDNFDRVDDGLYRGAQPSERGIAELKNRGVQTVIDLRDDRNPNEQKWVENAGMRYINIPSNASRVEPAKVAQFLDAMNDSPGPVFVHCKQGRDRTGLAVGAYRMVDQDWTREATLKDLYDHGYHWALFPGIARYLKTFDPAQFKNPAESNHLPATSS
jgi:uncharacterized protein (TIGR01244 family)